MKISFDGTDLYGNSLIISIADDEAHFLLDTIVDSQVHDRIAAKKPFTLYATLDGVDVRVDKVTVDSVIDDPDGFLYKVAKPSQVYYIQRRETFRAALSGLFEILATVEVPADNDDATYVVSECKMSNISAAGCQLEIPTQSSERIIETSKAVNIQFVIPETNDDITVSAMMRHNRELKRAELTLIGFQFMGISPGCETRVERFVAKVQQMARHNGLI